MKAITTIVTLIIALALTACGSGSSNKNKLVHPETRANGSYAIHAYLLDGDCPNPPSFELIIRDNAVYENEITGPFEITGELLKDFDIKALATLDDGTLVEINASLINFQSISGDWHLLDGSCHGYLEGQRI